MAWLDKLLLTTRDTAAEGGAKACAPIAAVVAKTTKRVVDREKWRAIIIIIIIVDVVFVVLTPLTEKERGRGVFI